MKRYSKTMRLQNQAKLAAGANRGHMAKQRAQGTPQEQELCNRNRHSFLDPHHATLQVYLPSL